MIYFVRHGSTDWNEHINEKGQRDPKLQGRADIPLNNKGIAQALATAETLKNIKFDRVICSPLTRTRQTCDIIYNGDKPVEYDERIIERDFGEFEGFTRTQFDFKAYCNAFSSPKLLYAEPIPAVQDRVYNLLDELKRKPNENVLIVSHGGVGCLAVSYFKGIPENGDYSVYEIPNGKPLTLDFKELENSKTNLESDCQSI